MIDTSHTEFAVQQLFLQFRAIRESLTQPSDRVDLDSSYRKLMVLSCASHLEGMMILEMKALFLALGAPYGEWVRVEAIERKFHTWFDWKKPMPDLFFKKFGKSCTTLYSGLDEGSVLLTSGKAFVRLVSERNILVHQDLASNSSELTPEEVETMFNSAVLFPAEAIALIRLAGASESRGPNADTNQYDPPPYR